MDALFSFLTGTAKPPPLPLAKETGRLLGEMQKQVKDFQNSAEVAKLHTATKLAMLEFNGVDCTGKAKIVDLKVGPAELIAMANKAVRAVTAPMRRVYLSVESKDVERAMEELISKMQDLVRTLRALGKEKKRNEMLAMVCFLQASINKLTEATEQTAALAAAPLKMPKLTPEAKALLEEVQMEHDFDMLDDLLAEARAQSIPTAPTTKPQSSTRKGRGQRNGKRKVGSTRRSTKALPKQRVSKTRRVLRA